MRIDVNVYPLPDRGKVKAMATLMIAGQFVITGIRLMESDRQGYYIKMPSYRSQEYDDFGRVIYKDHVVLNKELYAAVKEQVVEKYKIMEQGFEVETVRAADLVQPVPTVSVTKLESIQTGNLQAEASICIGGQAYVNGMRVLSGKNNNLFVAMPSMKVQKDRSTETEYREICFPVTKDMRTSVNTAVLSDYLARKDQRIRPEDTVIELRDEGGKIYYWHCYTPMEQTEMRQTLYREDYTVMAETAARVPFEEFLSLTGARVNATDFLPCRGTDVIQCIKAHHEALITGQLYRGRLSAEERVAVADTWFYRLTDDRYMSVKKTEYPYSDIQVQVSVMDKSFAVEQRLVGNGSSLTLAAQDALKKAGIDSDCTAVPTAYYYLQKHRKAEKEEQKWKTETKATVRRF